MDKIWSVEAELRCCVVVFVVVTVDIVVAIAVVVDVVIVVGLRNQTLKFVQNWISRF